MMNKKFEKFSIVFVSFILSIVMLIILFISVIFIILSYSSNNKPYPNIEKEKIENCVDCINESDFKKRYDFMNDYIQCKKTVVTKDQKKNTVYTYCRGNEGFYELYKDVNGNIIEENLCDDIKCPKNRHIYDKSGNIILSVETYSDGDAPISFTLYKNEK